MDFEQLFADFQYQDLQWFLPVLAGLVIIVGGLLIGVIRGMTAGVIVALFFGGLMSMSPVLLNALQRTTDPVSQVSADVARGAAELAVLNNEVTMDLSRVVQSLRTTMDGLSPMVTARDDAQGQTGIDPDLAQRFTQGLSDTEDRLDATLDTMSRANRLRQRLEGDMEALEMELRRAGR
jgi:hypothetical protein